MHSTAVLQTDLRNPAELIPHPDNPRGEIDSGTLRACWIARIYTPPLDCLERTVKPHIEPKPLSMHPDAVRGRQRFVSAVKKARERFTEIRGELS